MCEPSARPLLLWRHGQRAVDRVDQLFRVVRIHHQRVHQFLAGSSEPAENQRPLLICARGDISLPATRFMPSLQGRHHAPIGGAVIRHRICWWRSDAVRAGQSMPPVLIRRQDRRLIRSASASTSAHQVVISPEWWLRADLHKRELTAGTADVFLKTSSIPLNRSGMPFGVIDPARSTLPTPKHGKKTLPRPELRQQLRRAFT